MASMVFAADDLLTPAEVAPPFRVDAKTVTRWATAARLTSIRTLGGHRRYPAGEVAALLADNTTQASSGPAADEAITGH